jgi:peptide/nickel transport system permease protein
VTLAYALRRIAFFFLIVWATATAMFLLVHLAPGDPVSYQVGRLQASGAGLANGPQLVAEYKRQFGLDHSLLSQYWAYLVQLAHFNLGYSIVSFPTKVTTLIGTALPWTVGLVATATLFSFVVGSLLGGLLAWRSTPRLLRMFLPLLMIFQAIPQYLLALVLLYVFAYKTHLLPASGASDVLGSSGGFLGSELDILKHSLLPGLSIVLAFLGFWMLGMRSMMVSVLGSDYLMLAEAKGLSARRIFFNYGLRTAILPQITSLAIFVGYVVSGAIIIEIMFAYPGLGKLLYAAINGRDYPLIEGISLMIVLMVSGSMLVLDLLLPLIDPRIRYGRR